MSKIQIRDIVCEPGQKVNGFLDVAEKPGSMVRLPIMIANGAQEGPAICLVGGTHSTEYTGIISIIRLMKELDPSKLTGSVIVVPVINLPGFEVIKAFNPIDGMEILEACPGNPEGSITHRITYIFFQEILSHSDYVIDFHGGGRATRHMENTIYRLIDNEEIDKLSEGMARHFLLEYISLRKITKSYRGIAGGASLMGKPGFVVEIGDQGRVREELVEMTLRGIYNVLKYLKIIGGEPQKPPEQKIMRQIVRLSCNRGGIFLTKKEPADPIAKGEVIGKIMDLFGNVLEEITAPFDGLIYSIYDLPPINSGDITFMVASFEGELFYKGGGYKGYREITKKF